MPMHVESWNKFPRSPRLAPQTEQKLIIKCYAKSHHTPYLIYQQIGLKCLILRLQLLYNVNSDGA